MKSNPYVVNGALGISITVTISEDYKGWWWYLPPTPFNDGYKRDAFGPFKIEALAQKHCAFFVANFF
jgi:hypothetical protein